MKHQVLLQDYQNLKKDFEQLEIKRNGKESDFTNVLDDLNKMEVLKVNLENRLENLEKENKDLMANEISLSSDLKKRALTILPLPGSSMLNILSIKRQSGK